MFFMKKLPLIGPDHPVLSSTLKFLLQLYDYLFECMSLYCWLNITMEELSLNQIRPSSERSGKIKLNILK